MIKTKEDSRELIVPLRLNSDLTFFAPLAAVIGGTLFYLIIMSPGPVKIHPPLFFWAQVSTAVATTVPLPFCTFYRCRARLVLSETGLRWRTWGDWQRTTWNGVRDYYDLLSDDDPVMAIITDAGNICFDRKWSGSEAVRRWVQARATAAETTEWGVLGLRSCASDTRTFVYRRNSIWFTLLFNCGFFLPYIVFGWYWMLHGGAAPFWKMLIESWMPGHFWISFFTKLFGLLFIFFEIIGVNCPLHFIFLSVPVMLEIWKRRAERITTQHTGIVFEDGRRQISVAWNEVTSYYIHPSVYSQSAFFRITNWIKSRRSLLWWVYVVETTQGSFEYSWQIEGYKQLAEIMRDRALPLKGRKGPPLPVGGASGS